MSKMRRRSESARSSSTLADAARLSVLRGEYDRLLQSSRYATPLRLNRFGYSLYSQGDEDGIIAEIFNRIGSTERTFLEIGCGTGMENNTHALLLQDWSGLWIDGDNSTIQDLRSTFRDRIITGHLSVEASVVSKENVNSLVAKSLSGTIDLLSLDIDGNDFHVLQELDCVSPRVIVAEYNARKGPSIDWVMDYDPFHTWDGSDYFGASLKALERLLSMRGYSLVGCSTRGVNAFFVRDDLASRQFLSPFTSEEHFEPQRLHLRLGMHTSHRRDYGPWTTSERLME